MIFDLCVIGHATRDRIEIASDAPRVLPGGTVQYAGTAGSRLGLRTHVVTKMRASDRQELLSNLESLGISVCVHASPVTTEFVNIFPSAPSDVRLQKVLSVASPFQPSEITTKARAYLFGPLTRSEMDRSCIEPLASRGARVALDVQGLLRETTGTFVELGPNPAALELLAWVDVLKANAEEAYLLTGSGSIEQAARRLAAAGPSEILITSGSEGSHVFAKGRLTSIPAYPPAEVVDTTGCGDTYVAAYLARRLAGSAVEASADYASRVAGAKAGYHGALREVVPHQFDSVAA